MAFAAALAQFIQIFKQIVPYCLKQKDFFKKKYYFILSIIIVDKILSGLIILLPKEQAKPIVRWGRKATGLFRDEKIAGLPKLEKKGVTGLFCFDGL
jgi:hypothetical protein